MKNKIIVGVSIIMLITVAVATSRSYLMKRTPRAVVVEPSSVSTTTMLIDFGRSVNSLDRICGATSLKDSRRLLFAASDRNRWDYVIEDGSIYHIFSSDKLNKWGDGHCAQRIEGADVATFVSLGKQVVYHTVYWNNDIADVATVAIFGKQDLTQRVWWNDGRPSYAKDKNHVYFHGQIIKNADPGFGSSDGIVIHFIAIE